MEKKNKIMLGVIGVALLVFTLIGATAAYFTAQLTGQETATTITAEGGVMNLVYADNNPAITVNNIIPDNNPAATKTFTLTATNSLDFKMPYTLSLVVDANTFSEYAISYTLESTNNHNNGSEVPTKNVHRAIPTGAGSYELGSGYFKNGTDRVHSYVLNIYFLDNGLDQSENQGKVFKAHVGISAGKARDDQALLSLDLSTPSFSVGGSISATSADDVPIPQGFYYVGGTKNTGLVISDNIADQNQGDNNTAVVGNQFVWVPCVLAEVKVSGIPENPVSVKWAYTEYEGNVVSVAVVPEPQWHDLAGDSFPVTAPGRYTVKIELVDETIIENIVVSKKNPSYTVWGNWWDAWPMAYQNTINEALPVKVTGDWGQTAKSQIEKYGGFYVARHSMGIPLAKESEYATQSSRGAVAMPESKFYLQPWSYRNWDNTKASAEMMYSTSYVQSGLVTGTDYDTMVKWLDSAGVNLTKGNYSHQEVTDIVGGYSTNALAWNSETVKPIGLGALVRTGYSSKMNNIYDLAGNVMEWTSEKREDDPVGSGTYRFIQRGSYFNSGTGSSAAERTRNVRSQGNASGVGGRVMLYIK